MFASLIRRCIPVCPRLTTFQGCNYSSVVELPIQQVIFNRYKDSSERIRIYSVIDELEDNGLSMKDIRLAQTAKLFKKSVETGDGTVNFEDFRYMIDPCLSIISKSFQGRLIFPNFQSFQEKVAEIYEEIVGKTGGKIVDNLPELRKYSPDNWGFSICTIDGQQYACGDSHTYFPVQACINPILYGYALTHLGEAVVHRYVGHEPTAYLHDKVHLADNGLPHNPMISSGAFCISALIHPELTLSDRIVSIITLMEKCAGISPLSVDIPTYLSEKNAAFRAYSLAYLMQSKNAFPEGTDIIKVLNLYFQMTSIKVTCDILSRVAATIANYGVNPFTGERVFTTGAVKRMLSLMNSCGLYNASSSFAFEIGIPSKSNSIGCILSVVPGKLGYCTWSPCLDEKGQSVRGLEFNKRLVQEFNFHIFTPEESSDSDPRFASYYQLEHKLTAILYAAKQGSVGTLQTYFFSGYSLDLVDYDNRAPLHISASEGHLEASKFLVESCGVNINVKDRWKQTPLDGARLAGFESVAEYLEQNGAKSGTDL
ncbi:glutaminase kidney isoform, mitochondrial isoform 1 precursor [Oopsacas minuta]|uniref:glutaminase n=1 Tax=Oopsacas minuta TaxID=111878 RepID=A0AAV7JZH5_9METZ|nr:glutaminase kidney isoform, mitochondrial isoform 1 precursor [Oopsacas minuta]